MPYPYMPTFQPTTYTPYPIQPPAPANTLPAQQVLQANGKQSIDAIRMAPNSSVLVMDTTAPIVWLCTSDGLGNVTSAPYDITPHKDAKPAEIGDLETRLATVERSVNEIMQKWRTDDAEPNASSSKSKQIVRNDE